MIHEEVDLQQEVDYLIVDQDLDESRTAEPGRKLLIKHRLVDGKDK